MGGAGKKDPSIILPRYVIREHNMKNSFSIRGLLGNEAIERVKGHLGVET